VIHHPHSARFVQKGWRERLEGSGRAHEAYDFSPVSANEGQLSRHAIDTASANGTE
jgi:hypothetical protein